MVRRAIAVLAGAAGLAAPAAAQRPVQLVQTLDAELIGIARRGVGATISPSIQRDGRLLSVGAAATGTFAESAHLFYEGTLLADWRALRTGPLTLGVGGAGSAGGYRNLQRLDPEQLYIEGGRGRTFAILGLQLRADAGGEGYAGWLVASSPSVLELSVRRPLHAELGGALELGRVLLYSSLAHDGVGRRALFAADANLTVPGSGTQASSVLRGAEPGEYRLRSTTLLAGGQWVRGRAELSGEVAQRLQHHPRSQLSNVTARSEYWGRLHAAWRLGTQLTLRATYGSYPYDYLREIPGAKYVAVGARVQRGSRPPIDYYRPPALPAFRIDTIAGGARTIRLRAPRAEQVELSADFTDWTPVPMRKGKHGEWEVVLPIPPGTYRLSVRLDGGEWRAPPGLVAQEDEFAGEVAVVVLR